MQLTYTHTKNDRIQTYEILQRCSITDGCFFAHPFQPHILCFRLCDRIQKLAKVNVFKPNVHQINIVCGRPYTEMAG